MHSLVQQLSYPVPNKTAGCLLPGTSHPTKNSKQKMELAFYHRKWVSNGQLLGMKTMVRDQAESTQPWSHVT